MFNVKVRKWNHLTGSCKSLVLSKEFKTKREAIAYIKARGFVPSEVLREDKRKLPEHFCNYGMRCSAFIFKS